MSTETNPLNILPPEINFLIFTFFSTQDLLRASVVCKIWRDFINTLPDFFWQKQCLQKQKNSDDSWKTHAIRLHKQVRCVEKQEFTTDYTEFHERKEKSSNFDFFFPSHGGIISRGKAACSFASYGEFTTDFAVWDLEKEIRIENRLFYDGESYPIAIDYPYLVTQNEQIDLLIRDFSKDFTLINRILFPHYVEHASIQETSLIWCDKKNIYLVRNFLNKSDYETIRDLNPLYNDEIHSEEVEYQDIASPILHNGLLIYGIENGIIRVRDLNSDELTILYDLKAKHLEKLELKRVKNEILNPDLAEIINLVAHGNLLVSFVQQDVSNIHIWDLETKTRIRVMTGNIAYPLRINILNHLIILSEYKLVKIWDIFSNKCIKEFKEITIANSNYTPTILFGHRIYQLSYASSLRKILDYSHYQTNGLT